MKKIIKYLFLLFILICEAKLSLAQQNKIVDSLLNDLRPTNLNLEDTIRMNTLNNLGWELKDNDPDTAIILSTQALSIALKNKWQAGENESYLNLGVFNDLKGNYPIALDYYFKSLKISELLNDEKGISNCLSSIGIVLEEQGYYPKALDYYFKALKIRERLKDKKVISSYLTNIGNIYTMQGDYSMALVYYFKALKMAEVVGNKKTISHCLGNIGNCYGFRKDYPQALDYFFKALKIAEELGDKVFIANNLGNMGLIYKAEGDSNYAKGNTNLALNDLYPKALTYYFKALKIAEEFGDKYSISFWLGYIGNLYLKTNRSMESEEYLQRALALSTEINALDLIKAHEEILSDLFTQKHQPAKAFDHYKKYIAAKDSIFNEENTKKTVRSEMNFNFEKKEAVANAEHKSEMDKQNAIAEEKSRKQKIIIISIIAGLFLVIVFAGFIARSLRTTRKQKQIIEIKEQETQHQNSIISQQKHLIEEKHKEIKDSINYAERIQRSLLASSTLLNENLNDYFVFFQPKDIVSGDFYWASKLSNGNFALLTADSTGHGVPGAIMSILNISCLEKAIEVEKLVEPSEILNHTRTKIIETLKKDGSPEGGKDGMDCSLISFDFENNKLTYCAANNPVWIVRAKQILEFAVDKMPVGKHDRDSVSFTTHTIDLQQGDIVYAISDGMPDQFGGPKGKKFMSKQLRELLVFISDLPLNEQKEKVSFALNDWKGNLEQVDDVTIIGVRV